MEKPLNVSLPVLIALLVVVLIVGAFVLAPRVEVVTEVEIDAPPDRVWSVLGDPRGYRDWNPFILSMEGALTEGATIVNRMKPESGREMSFRPRVLKAEPGRELRWLGRLLVPRIFDGEHYFLLEEHGGGTRLIHGEHFRGMLLWFMDVQRFRSDFERMNAALKARVETGEAAP